MEEYVSSWIDVLCGVPQVSVLGALLFVVYVNDLTMNKRNNVNIYCHLCCNIESFWANETLQVNCSLLSSYMWRGSSFWVIDLFLGTAFWVAECFEFIAKESKVKQTLFGKN
ncbi:hypothetical protein HELRODRAFT_171358 [Helobdella robusta]|uniref:Uncharacterized protein n=1 Tax=Helobdella robusta TaxID=6412 RepID=T1F462_HELRO|nr:hypothetical protein HELRODRAFT_171358 [Helobdella robusta]ESO05698.1 hypothetical protein HELRODRAFT_171358 [Helobdella robusta]